MHEIGEGAKKRHPRFPSALVCFVAYRFSSQRAQPDIDGDVSDYYLRTNANIWRSVKGSIVAYLTQHNVSSLNKSVVISGTLLGLASLLEILAMAHHPSVRTLDISQAVARVARLSHFTALAHGVLIGLMLVIAYGMSDFVLFRGPRRPLMRAGCIAYFAGVVSMIGAALVSGWVIADVASLTPHVTEIDRQINAQLFTLCSVVNQTCANFGVVAMSAGIGFWSLDLLRDVGFQRIVGVIGCAISLGLIGALTGGALHLDVSGMDNVVQLQAVWNIAAGATLVTYGRQRPEAAANT